MQTDVVSGPIGAPAPPRGFESLGREDFLRLLVTKLRHQDPLRPGDDAEFVAQLAQFSALEQAIQSNSLLGRIVEGQDGAARARLMELLGRTVLVRGGSTLHVAAGAPERLAVQVGAEASRVRVEIVDGSGRTVRSLEIGPRPAGRAEVAWDGLDDAGIPVPDGAYAVRVTAADAGGRPVEAEPLVYIRIDALRLVGGAIVPLSRDRAVDVAAIVEVTT